MRCLSCLTYFVLFLAIVIGVGIVYLKTPGPSGFGHFSESTDVVPASINLKGKNVIVTGGYSGIGIDTVETLALRGAQVWLPARDLKKCEQVISQIKKATGNSGVYCEEMDLSSLESVRKFAEKWNSKNLPLHILINNAGIMGSPYLESVDGYELQFATNHLGHFLLTNLLMNRLKEGKPSRVINVSSEAHRMSGIHFEDLSGNGTWFNPYLGNWLAYGQSKSANILFTVELNQRMKPFGTAYSLHPGTIVTNLQKYARQAEKILFFFVKYFAKTPSQGASTQLYLAVTPNLEGAGGKYFSDCNEATPSSHASDPVLAKKLWDISEQMTKLK